MTMHLAGINNLEQISLSNRSLVYRGIRGKDERPVIVKIPARSFPAQQDLRFLRKEWELLRDVSRPGIIQVYDLVRTENGQALLREDRGGTALRQYAAGPVRPLAEFLRVATGISRALCDVHGLEIIHRGISPENIIVVASAAGFAFTDFGQAVRAGESRSEAPDLETGAQLAYVSPEQTVHMNSSVGYPADLYALGVVLYELATGQLPFTAGDTMGWVHSHLARRPVDPASLRPELSPALVAVLMKCLAKRPEERYQSATGLLWDLERCAAAPDHQPPGFRPGERDRSAHLRVSTRLYGRHRPFLRMLKSFRAVVEGDSRVLFLAGYSGVGKTSFVRAAHRHVVERGGYFVSGKCDPLRSGIPYAVFLDALRELIRLSLKREEMSIRDLRRRLRRRLRGNAGVLTSMIHDAELLLGPQPAPAELRPAEAWQRFLLSVRDFLTEFATESHPVFFFLDDVQWIDGASLRLLEAFTGMPYVYLVCAYRDNEVGPEHALRAVMERMRAGGVRLELLQLQALEPRFVDRLIEDTFACPKEPARALGDLVHEKTGGNPFFIQQFLYTLHGAGWLRFHGDYGWQWDLSRVESANITDNVVDLMIARVGRFESATREALGAAAVLGNAFDLTFLARMRDVELPVLLGELEAAFATGMIRTEETTNGAGLPCTFLHDRIRQAAYDMIAADKLPSLHLRAGRMLRREGPGDGNIFEIVNHLNRGVSALTDAGERRDLAELNLRAAMQAREANAFETMHTYCRQGVELLPARAFEESYRLAFELHLLLFAAGYLTGHFDAAQRLYQELSEKTQSRMDLSRVYNNWIILETNRENYASAIETGITALRLFGIELNRDTAVKEAMQLYKRANKLQGDRTAGDLFNAPEIEDPEKLMVLELLVNLTSVTYMTDYQLSFLVPLHMVLICIEHGNTPVAAHAYALYGMFLSGIGAYQRAYQYGLLAIQLSEKYAHPQIRSKVHYLFCLAVRHWVRPARGNIAILEEAHAAGVESGDILYSGYASMAKVIVRYLAGEPLDAVLAEADRGFAYLQDIHLTDIALVVASIRHGAQLLRGDPTPAPADLSEQELRSMLSASTFPSALHLFLVVKLGCAVYLNEEPVSMELVREVMALADSATSQYQLADMYFFVNLAMLNVPEDAPGAEERHGWIKESGRFLEKLAKVCPENFEHRRLLSLAETARLAGESAGALALYEQAINTAGRNDCVHHAALAAEMAGRFAAGLQLHHVAQTYFLEAVRLYDSWGARSRVLDITRQYPALAVGVYSTDQALPALVSSVHGQLATLDLQTVLKASLAISNELKLSSLLEKVLTLLLENSGAERVLFIRKIETGFLIEAEAEPGSVRPVRASLAAYTGDLPAAVINLAARTGEVVLLDDSHNAAAFVGDEYLESRPRGSILCMPIAHQGVLAGLLYLENSLATGVFTTARLQVIRMLGSQAASSIQNALLYESLEEQVQERTSRLVEAEKMASLGRLVAGVAHEFNTPLGTGITAASTLMDETAHSLKLFESAGELRPAQITDYLDFARDAGRMVLDNLHRISRLVMSFKQIAVDPGAHETRDFVLMELLRDVVASMQTRLEEGGHNVLLEGDAEIAMLSYPGFLTAIVMNLLENSLEHAFEPGVPGNIRMHIGAAGETTVRLVYSDDGRGIPSGDQSRVFEPFFTTDHTSGGRGLGLHSVYNLVRHGLLGTIELSGSNGSGVTFTLELPVELDGSDQLPTK